MLRRRQQEGGPPLSDREFRELLSCRETVASPDPRFNLAQGIPTVRDLMLQFGKSLAEPEPGTQTEPIVNSPPRVGKPGPKPKPIPENLRKAIERRWEDPDANGNTQQAIADQLKVPVGRVKYIEGRMKRERPIARNSAQ